VTLKPFFCYYGGKWRAAPRYPKPQYDTIIEPFAGAAGYSVRHHERNVILYEIDPKIFGIWDYLLNVSETEIRSLPVNIQHVDDLDVPQEAKWLIGFWINKGSATPKKQPSTWMKSPNHESEFWGKTIRERIASQLFSIRHWKVFNKSYTSARNRKATWFIDPPYNNSAGRRYRYSLTDEEFEDLAIWCRGRRGQTIVCENLGADWLDFEPFATIRAANGKHKTGYSHEVIWSQAL
jgi:site-specific DNA-adenine methylase